VSKTPAEAFIELPSDESVGSAAARGSQYDFGFVANMGKLIRAHPRIGARFGALFAEIMFVPGALDRREREMVAAVAAAAQDCHY
jgi:alkylhydroperoxidase/carboxymuconolactone decarboxylase family protein YurZ